MPVFEVFLFFSLEEKRLGAWNFSLKKSKKRNIVRNGSKELVAINKDVLFYADYRAWDAGNDAFDREHVGQVWSESFAYCSNESYNSSLR